MSARFNGSVILVSSSAHRRDLEHGLPANRIGMPAMSHAVCNDVSAAWTGGADDHADRLPAHLDLIVNQSRQFEPIWPCHWSQLLYRGPAGPVICTSRCLSHDLHTLLHECIAVCGNMRTLCQDFANERVRE